MNASQLATLMLTQGEQPTEAEAAPANEVAAAPAEPIMPIAAPEPVKEKAPEPIKEAAPAPPKEAPKKVEEKPVAKVAKPAEAAKTNKPILVEKLKPEGVTMEPKIPVVAAIAEQKAQSLVEKKSDQKTEELQESISSIAERVMDEKRHDQAQHAENVLQAFSDKLDATEAVDALEAATRPLTMSERAEKKFKAEEGEVKKQIEEAVDNPISQYYAEKHPEIVSEAQEQHYLTDHI